MLLQRHPTAYQEILDVLSGVEVAPPSSSREKGKKGRLVYRGGHFNPQLKKAFKARGWGKSRFTYPGQNRFYVEIDFFKGSVGVEVQLGKYSFVAHDLNKFLDAFNLSFGTDEPLDVGVEIIPSARLAGLFYSGVANFDSVVTAVTNRGRNTPPVPIWLIGIDVEG